MTTTNSGGNKRRYRIVKIEKDAQEQLPFDEGAWLPKGKAYIQLHTSPPRSSSSVTSSTYARRTVTWNSVGSTATPISFGSTFTPAPQPVSTSAPLGVSLSELEQKEEWNTTECAFYCGLSKTSWHVYSARDGVAPTQIGKGRGKQNLWLAEDVKKYQAARVQRLASARNQKR